MYLYNYFRINAQCTYYNKSYLKLSPGLHTRNKPVFKRGASIAPNDMRSLQQKEKCSYFENDLQLEMTS